MQPIVNQDGGQCGMGAKNAPSGNIGPNKSEGAGIGEAKAVETKVWRASNGSTVSSIQPLVDGPND